MYSSYEPAAHPLTYAVTSGPATAYSDFIPNTSLNVMHDHFYNAWSGVWSACIPNASGVLVPSATEEGGDIYTCTQLTEYLNTYGAQLQYHHL